MNSSATAVLERVNHAEKRKVPLPRVRVAPETAVRFVGRRVILLVQLKLVRECCLGQEAFVSWCDSGTEVHDTAVHGHEGRMACVPSTTSAWGSGNMYTNGRSGQ